MEISVPFTGTFRMAGVRESAFYSTSSGIPGKVWNSASLEFLAGEIAATMDGVQADDVMITEVCC